MSELAQLFLIHTHNRPDEDTETKARAWAQDVEAWATHQIRYYCWDYLTAERIVCRVREAAKDQ